ncbi:efflux RND transporter periplasmic adaptor subunit [Actinoplanes sp. NBC_00393]|uniref:efflux RND transporter periplasmic adaptor subunit n=1 Tax=Actinoplanes sp. NBC_00393 TaxID=2975953 RepID=UPI002E241A2E
MKALPRPSTAVNALLALLIVGAVCWGWTLLRDTDADTGANASGVRTLTATQGTVTRTVTADGAVESASTATATFGTPGTVTSIKVKVGQTVAAGTLLARIDPADAQRELALARADLAAATHALDRAEAAGTDTTTAITAMTQAELAVDAAEAAVAGTNLIAPVAGTVIAVNGSIGGPSGSEGFVDLADLGKLQVRAAFSEAAATELKEGQSATVVWNALEGTETTGQVVAVDPAATKKDGVVTYGVAISLPNPPEGTRPGQTVSVSVVTGSVENAVTINSAAVTTISERRSVTVVGGDGKHEVRQIQVGLEGDEAYQVTSGLAAGERVIVPTASSTGGL